MAGALVEFSLVHGCLVWVWILIVVGGGRLGGWEDLINWEGVG